MMREEKKENKKSKLFAPTRLSGRTSKEKKSTTPFFLLLFVGLLPKEHK
jgi:hypothetical protein